MGADGHSKLPHLEDTTPASVPPTESAAGILVDSSTPSIPATVPDCAMLSAAWIESHPPVMVPIDSLRFDGSPRLCGEDPEHVRMLAEASGPLPPITVHAPTMRVIDGVHRVRAARLNSAAEIQARMLDCDEQSAFILAVKANISHGLPLSKDDRTTAAIRIIANHPDWSDRAVAAVTGLSDKTVSRIRVRSVSQTPPPSIRRGRDGRLRPLDTTEKRQQAAVMIAERPDSGLRQIAKATGLSLSTVQDVRQRVNRGENPVPSRYRPAKGNGGTVTAPLRPPSAQRTRYKESPVDRRVVLAKLNHDPSLKFTEAGRHLLHWLHRHTLDVNDVKAISASVPDHWTPVISELAYVCAAAWNRLAGLLEERPLGLDATDGDWNSEDCESQRQEAR